MCGIYGYFGKIKASKHKKVLKLMKALAIRTEVRGKDSAGFYARSMDYEITEKQAVRAKKFLKNSKLMSDAILKEHAHVFIGHNRQASIGAINNDNAHPFSGDNIALVHNGTSGEVFDLISDEAYEKMEGETDSEAMMLHFNEVGPRHIETWQELDSYAVVMYENKTDCVYFARDDKRPMAIFDLRKKYGIRVFASTHEIAENAFRDVGLNPEKIGSFRTRPYALYKGNPTDGEVNKLSVYGVPTFKRRQTVINPAYGSEGSYRSELYDYHDSLVVHSGD